MAPRRLSCQISANQRVAETSLNVNKDWKTRAKDNDVITYVIFANQHFASTFSMQIFKFQRRSCKLSFLPPPASAARAPRRACSQARTGTVGHTQGTKGFSCAVSGVLKSDPREKLYLFSRGFAARVFGLRPTKRSSPSHARKKPLVPRVSRSLRVLLCGRFRVRFGPRCVLWSFFRFLSFPCSFKWL